jgi:hypothetical protein
VNRQVGTPGSQYSIFWSTRSIYQKAIATLATNTDNSITSQRRLVFEIHNRFAVHATFAPMEVHVGHTCRSIVYDTCGPRIRSWDKARRSRSLRQRELLTKYIVLVEGQIDNPNASSTCKQPSAKCVTFSKTALHFVPAICRCLSASDEYQCEMLSNAEN